MARQLDVVSRELKLIRISLTERCDELTNWPPTGKESQQAAVCSGQELKQEGTIDGQVASHAKTNASVQSASSNPVGCRTGGNTEGTGNEKSTVECQTTTDNIRHDAPEGCTNAQAEEEGEGSVSDLVRVDTELFSHRRERQGDTLKPEAGAIVSANSGVTTGVE